MFAVAIAAAILAGCRTNSGLSVEDVAMRLEQKYVGKNIDALVADLGPPKSSFKMNSGDTAYFWQLSSSVEYNFDRYGGKARERPGCNINAVSSPTGIVTKLGTQDEKEPSGPIAMAVGVNINDSRCAQRLGIRQ